MKKLLVLAALALLAACQSAPKLEDDARYVKMAKVMDVHEYTDAERKEAKKQRPSDSGLGFGIGIGVGTGGGFGFGGMMMGGGGRTGSRNEPPQVAFGAKRFTVQLQDTGERLEVMSYGKYKVGDCVKVLTGHPTEYARLFDLKQGERCN